MSFIEIDVLEEPEGPTFSCNVQKWTAILGELPLLALAGAVDQPIPITADMLSDDRAPDIDVLAKLKNVADRLRATVLRPYYPASGLFRVIRDDDGLQVDFMTSIHGVRSFEGLRDRASRLNIEGTPHTRGVAG